MGVTPINVARVSQNLRAFNLMNSVRSGQLGLFRAQNQLATGLRFNAPSEDPTRAADAIKLDRRLDLLGQVQRNLGEVNATMQEVESAMQAATDLVRQAHTLALETTGDTTSPDDRESARSVIESVIDQLIAVGNRSHLGAYLFSGHLADDAPFEWIDKGVVFHGDNGRLQTIIDSDLSEDTFTISGMEFYNAVSQSVQGYVNLDPAVTRETRLVDLNGALGAGVRTGRISISDGATQTNIDLTGADTVGDVIDKLNAEMPATLLASIDDQAINISSVVSDPLDVTVVDNGGGNVAEDLGISTLVPALGIAGEDLDPRVTPRTTIASLNAGAGADLSGGVTIRLGDDVAEVSFLEADTIEDVLNRINQTNIGVLARIGEDGQTIEVLNRVSGASLRIEENTGDAANVLGIRSMHADTLLSDLNDGLGVDSVDGDDIRITTADGSTVDIDIDDLDLNTATLQDVIDLIDKRGNGRVRAGLASPGNGIIITDNTAGPGEFRIDRLNLSPTIDSLGINVRASGGVLAGEDVNPIKVESPFAALLALREGLSDDDTHVIAAAGEDLLTSLRRMQEIQGQAAAKAASMLERADRIDDEALATEVLRSDVRDADLTETIVRFQQLQTALQANLATSSKIMSLSLLDYLG